jgi:hypothetical protein
LYSSPILLRKAKAKGEVRLDEGKIDIPGLERTAVADLGAWQP